MNKSFFYIYDGFSHVFGLLGLHLIIPTPRVPLNIFTISSV